MVTLPDTTPVTVPDDDPTVAINRLLLVHTPPPTPSVSVLVPAIQTHVEIGVIATGVILTVTVFSAEQPVAVVYEIVTVPDETPVTMPDVPAVAIPVAPLLHVPPGVTSARPVVPPTQTLTAPGGVIAEGLALTVTVAITKQVPVV